MAEKSVESPGTCLRVCSDVTATFERQKPTERNMEKVLADLLALSELNDTERNIVRGCGSYYERHRESMKATLSAFYHSEAGRLASRADYSTYIALLIIALTHRGYTTIDYFQRMVFTTRHYKTVMFLGEIFQEDGVGPWLEAVWCQHFDHHYVLEKLMQPLQEWQQVGREIVQDMLDRQEGKKQPPITRKSPTRTEPFNLTRPRARPILDPTDKVMKKTFHHAVPDSTYMEPEPRRLKTAEVKRSPVSSGFARGPAKAHPVTSHSKRVPKKKTVPAPVVAFVPKRVAPWKPPRMPEEPIKPTAASILRSGALAHRRETEQAKKVADLAAGGFDDTGFRKLMEEKEAQELNQRLTAIERNHLEGLLSFEQAVIAQEQLKLERHEQVSSLKAESEELLHILALKRMQEEEETRRIVEEILQGHENTKEARVKLQEQNKNIVKVFSQENDELLQRARMEAEAERKRRVDLIMQIRSMESVPIERFKEFDRMAAGDHGLLIEMSVSELQARLTELKLVAQTEEQERRQEINHDKTAKATMLEETARAASYHLEEYTRAEKRRKDEKEQRQKKAAQINDSKVSNLQMQLERRRQEKERLRDEVVAVSRQSRSKPSSRLGTTGAQSRVPVTPAGAAAATMVAPRNSLPGTGTRQQPNAKAAVRTRWTKSASATELSLTRLADERRANNAIASRGASRDSLFPTSNHSSSLSDVYPRTESSVSDIIPTTPSSVC